MAEELKPLLEELEYAVIARACAGGSAERVRQAKDAIAAWHCRSSPTQPERLVDEREAATALALDALLRLTECERIRVARSQSKTGWGFAASQEITRLNKEAWAVCAEAIKALRAARTNPSLETTGGQKQ